MTTNQEKIMESVSLENLEIKTKIDAFKRESAHKLQILAEKLALPINLEMVLRSKNNQKELATIREHKDHIEKTETLQKSNKDVEAKIEYIHRQLEDDEQERKEI